MRPLALLALIAAFGVASPAQASWPKPAAGPSASGGPEVIFTFDDGPHETRTSEILDELAKHKIQAIFFWVGYRVARNSKLLEARRAVLDRAVAEGHLIGNHTINHVHLCRGDKQAAEREIDVNREIYERLTGQPQILFRAPYGDHCDRLVAMLDERGIGNTHWDLDPREWKHHSYKRTVAYVTRRLKRLNGRAVLLLHDTKAATVRALPKILDWIDKENARRKKKGKKRIRILDASDLMLERMAPGLLDWADDTATEAGDLLLSSVRRIVPGTRLSALTRR